MPKLTKGLVDRAQPKEKLDAFVWDSEVIGFGLKVSPTGHKSFIYKYRNAEGRTKRLTIGTFSDTLTVEQARKIAKDHAIAVHSGKDPQADKLSRRDALTVGELLDAYLESEGFKSKAESTQGTDRGRVERHLRPLLEKEFADRLSPEQVQKAHRAITEGKTAAKVKTKARGLARVTGGEGTANKAIMLLSTAFKWATEQKPPLAKTNPVKMKCSPSGQRETILESVSEYKTMFDTIQKMQDEKRIRPAVADAIRLIALTGARRGEVAGLRWQWVDLKAGLITLPVKTHKTGKRTGKARYIALPSEAKQIIARQPDGKPEDYVFKPAKGKGPLALNKPWRDVRKEAGLPPNLVLHGLRHSLGSHLAMAGGSNVELMNVLGHTQVATTLRYTHFAERARSTLAERAASVATAGLKGKMKVADVEQLKEGTSD